MKRLMLPAGVVLAAITPTAAAAALGHSAGKSPTSAHAGAYERAYAAVVKKLGRRAPGRNIVKDGVAPGRPATDAETVASLVVLERMLTPVSTPAPTSSVTPVQTSSTSAPVSTAGASGVPACASESGTNYSTGASNTNPSSGATGRYQITPGTAANYGCNLSTSTGQDACAQTIYANQGASAWVGCGG